MMQKKYFDKVLLLDSNYYETWNQIINLGCSRNASSDLQKLGKVYFEKLLNKIRENQQSVSLRIKLSLVTFANYKQYRDISQKSENIEVFSNIIRQSYLQGFEQIYEAFVSFVRLYGYNYTEETRKLFESISSIVFIDVNYKNIKKFSDFLDAFSSVYGLIDESQKKDEIKMILISVVNSGLQEELNDFEKRVVLKTYNSIGLSDKAIYYFEKNCQKIEVDYTADDFYSLYHYAKALYLCDRYEDALRYCDIIKNIDASFNLNNTFEVEALCYKNLNQLDKARKSLENALKLTDEGKSKARLQELMADMEDYKVAD